ncbi:hypothetical protein P3L10_015572 [Capsicum annuum]
MDMKEAKMEFKSMLKEMEFVGSAHITWKEKGVGEHESSCTWWESSEETEITIKCSTSNDEETEGSGRKCKKRIWYLDDSGEVVQEKHQEGADLRTGC